MGRTWEAEAVSKNRWAGGTRQSGCLSGTERRTDKKCQNVLESRMSGYSVHRVPVSDKLRSGAGLDKWTAGGRETQSMHPDWAQTRQKAAGLPARLPLI